MFDLFPLQMREGTGIYAPGQARVVQILNTALEIMIEKGYRAVTLREIARRCGIRVGAVSYYYDSREALIRDLINGIADSYANFFETVFADESLHTEDKLKAMIFGIFDDAATKESTNIFPELWALATHDPFVARVVDQLYERGRVALVKVVAELNPALSAEERETVGVFICGTVAGQVIFAGDRKPWREKMPWIKVMAFEAVLSLVKTITAAQIRELSDQPHAA